MRKTERRWGCSSLGLGPGTRNVSGGRHDTTRAHIFDYAFLGAYNVAIVEDVLCKVDVGRSPAMFYLLDGLFDVGLCDGHCRWERRKGVFGVVAGFK